MTDDERARAWVALYFPTGVLATFTESLAREFGEIIDRSRSEDALRAEVERLKAEVERLKEEKKEASEIIDVLSGQVTEVNALRILLRESVDWLDEVCNPDNEDMRTDEGVAFRRRIDAALAGEESAVEVGDD